MPDNNSEKPDQERGLYRKYEVRRLNDYEGKHEDCEYFVMDVTHDKIARGVMLTYAEECGQEFPLLAQDIREWIYGIIREEAERGRVS